MNSKITKSVIAFTTAMLVCVSMFVGIIGTKFDENLPTDTNKVEVQQNKPQAPVAEIIDNDDTAKPADKLLSVVKPQYAANDKGGSTSGSGNTDNSNQGTTNTDNNNNNTEQIKMLFHMIMQK